MATEKGHIPASVLWRPSSIAVLIVGVMMTLIAASIFREHNNEQKAMNAFLTFKDALYREIAESSGRTQDQDIQAMAGYLREHREDLDKVLHQENIFRDSLDKAQRFLLHIQNPDKLPHGMLIITNSPHWKELRENPQDRAILIEILRNDAMPPEITLRNDPNFSRTFSWLWVLIPQLCGFLMYLLVWEDRNYRSRGYRWYQLSLLGKAGLALLMPGAWVVMIPMIMWAWCRGCLGWLRQRIREQYVRRDMLRKGASLDISSDAGRALLRKLQQSRTPKQEEARSGELI